MNKRQRLPVATEFISSARSFLVQNNSGRDCGGTYGCCVRWARSKLLKSSRLNRSSIKLKSRRSTLANLSAISKADISIQCPHTSQHYYLCLETQFKGIVIQI